MGFPARSACADVDGDLVELHDDDPMALMQHLGTGDWWSVFCLIDDGGALWRRMCSSGDGFNMAAAYSLVKSLVEEMTGYRWFTACSLAASAVKDWAAFDGLAAWRGFDPWSAPLARSLALVHHCIRSSASDPGEAARMEYRLAGPEAEDDPESAPVKLEAAAFAEWSAYFAPDGEALNAV